MLNLRVSTLLSVLFISSVMSASPEIELWNTSSYGYEQIVTGDAGEPDDYSSPVFDELTGQVLVPAEWTVMFYDDADCENMFDPFNTFVSEIQSTGKVDVIVLRDTETGPAYYYYVPGTGSPVILESLGEVNMGDAQTLNDFIAYSKTHYPANRYLLFVYDHGGGFYGACVDKSHGNDLLYMDEFQSAITANGGVDIITWLACCTMGALEAAYELRNCTDVYVGSEEGSSYNDWFGVISYISTVLNDSEDLSSEEIGVLIVNEVATNFDDYSTMSAIDQDNLEPLVSAFNELADYMVQNFADLVDVVEDTRSDAWNMGGAYFEWPEIDFYDFLLLYQAGEDDPGIQSRIAPVISLFDAAILAEAHGPEHDPRAHGLSIWFPEEYHERIEYYQGTNLDFADDTKWDEFLVMYFDWLTGIEGSSSQRSLAIFPSSNPSAGMVELCCSSNRSASATIGIIDIAGRRINEFPVNLNPGTQTSFSWNGVNSNGCDVPTGIYVVTIQDETGNSSSCKVLLYK